MKGHKIMSDAINVEKIFGEDVFGDSAMKERLPKNVYKELRKVIDEGAELSLVVADVVADFLAAAFWAEAAFAALITLSGLAFK